MADEKTPDYEAVQKRVNDVIGDLAKGHVYRNQREELGRAVDSASKGDKAMDAINRSRR